MAHAQNSNIEALIYMRKNNALPVVSVWAVEFALCVSLWAMRHRTRAALRRLTDDQLADIGLTRDQALSEAERVFWKA